MDDPAKNDEAAVQPITVAAEEKESLPTEVAPLQAPSNPSDPVVDPSSVRGTIGGGMDRFTQVINDNLVAARFGIFSGVTLLTVYGLSQTPLFFRYRTVADIPGMPK